MLAKLDKLLCYLVYPVSDALSPLRLNVGFIVAQTAGYSRDFSFDIPQIRLSPDLSLTNLKGSCRVTRTPQGLLLQAGLEAEVSAECVRCLSEFNQSLSAEFTELYAFSKRHMTDSGLLLPEDYHIDLAPLASEFLFLSMPISPLCNPDCKGLCPICGENRNQVTCQHDDAAGDERLLVLKDLLDKPSTTDQNT